MSDRETGKPRNNGTKYEKRQRKQTEKGEKLAEEMKRRKRTSQSKKNPICQTCESEIKDLNHMQHCTECSEPLHLICTVKLNNKDTYYCSKCVRQLKWNELEEFEASNCIKHLVLNVPKSAAVIKWRSPRQIEQNRLAAVARRQQRIIENQKKERKLQPTVQASRSLELKLSPEKELLVATTQLQDSIDSQIKHLIELQLSQRKGKGIDTHSEDVKTCAQEGIQGNVEKSVEVAQDKSANIVPPETVQVAENMKCTKHQDEQGSTAVSTAETAKNFRSQGVKAALHQVDLSDSYKNDDFIDSISLMETQKIEIETKSASCPENGSMAENSLLNHSSDQQFITTLLEELISNVIGEKEEKQRLSSNLSPQKSIEESITAKMVEDELLGITNVNPIIDEEEEYETDLSEDHHSSDFDPPTESEDEFLSDDKGSTPEDENGSEVEESNNGIEPRKSTTEFISKSSISSPEYISNPTLKDREISVEDFNCVDVVTPSAKSIEDTVQIQIIQEDEPTSEIVEPRSEDIRESVSRSKVNGMSILETLPASASIISPISIPVSSETEFYTAESDGKGFTCKLCQHTSVSKGGIKNHITRTHKVQRTLMHPPKIFCKKCRKEIKKKSDAGQCSKCSGFEHYRCTQSGKQHKALFQKGMPFKCVTCCIPGITISPDLSVRKVVQEEKTKGDVERTVVTVVGKTGDTATDTEESNSNGLPAQVENTTRDRKIKEFETTRKELADGRKQLEKVTQNSTIENKIDGGGRKRNDLSVVEGMNKPATRMDNDGGCGGTSTIKQLKQDNMILTRKFKEITNKEEQTKITMQLLSVDNTKLCDRIRELETENSNLHLQKVELQNENKTLDEKLNTLKIDNSKTKEVALEVQKVLTAAIKEANFTTFNKDKEIENLVKENERLKAENMTYKELLSPEIAQQRSQRSREITAKAVTSGDNSNNSLNNIQGSSIGHSSMGQFSNDSFERPTYEENENDDLEDEEEEYYAKSVSEVCEMSNDEHHQQPLPSREQRIRYCHFYNRNGCNTPNCRFLHDIAPICESFKRGQCQRRLCQYRHERDQNFMPLHARKPPDQLKQGRVQQDLQNPWIQIREKSPQPLQKPHTPARIVKHHRYRYLPDSSQNRVQYEPNNDDHRSYQGYPSTRQ